MKTTPKQRAEIVARLVQLGVTYEHAETLRRISTTLQRWFELECGTENDRGTSFSVERPECRGWKCNCGHNFIKEVEASAEGGEKETYCPKCHKQPLVGSPIFEGKPFLRMQYMAPGNQWIDRKSPVPDRETGARKRLAALMASYPDLVSYIQTDPRGCAVYILRRSDVNGCEIDSVYTRGVAVY